MFKEFIQRVTNWTLDKEEELAKNCKIPLPEIDKQINELKTKKDDLIKRCDEQKNEFDYLIQRLEKIRNTEVLSCNKI